jgi:hypothetical protein
LLHARRITERTTAQHEHDENKTCRPERHDVIEPAPGTKARGPFGTRIAIVNLPWIARPLAPAQDLVDLVAILA